MIILFSPLLETVLDFETKLISDGTTCETKLTENQCRSYSSGKPNSGMNMNVYDAKLPYGCTRKKDDVGSVVIQFNTYNLAQYKSNSLKHIPCGRDGVECICLKKGMYNE